jgi:transcription elongation factor Elf1
MSTINGYGSTTVTSSGDITTQRGDFVTWTVPVTTTAPIFTLTAATPETEDIPEIIPPKCFQCGKEVESVCSYVKNKTLTIILRCHDDERRVDISLKRFKGDKVDAIDWFSDTFQWVFGEEAQWRKVKPEPKVATVHADRKIISDWLDNI